MVVSKSIKFYRHVIKSGADPGGGRGVPIPSFFWKINAFEWGHVIGTPLCPGLGTPLFKMIQELWGHFTPLHGKSLNSSFL